MSRKSATAADLAGAAAVTLLRLDGKEVLAKYLRARIAELRVANDSVALGKKKTIELRGRLAELRELHGKLYPDVPATDDQEDLDRQPLY